jgi:small subunit ribosomal protein S13
MARIAGVDIPREKRLEIALTYIYGIGRTRSQEICAALDINPDTRVRDLTDDEVARIRNHIEAHVQGRGRPAPRGGAGHQAQDGDRCWQGLRHRRGLPVRGQRTQTNARTRKGPKKTVAGKKKARK